MAEDKKAMNVKKLPSLNVNTGKQGFSPTQKNQVMQDNSLSMFQKLVALGIPDKIEKGNFDSGYIPPIFGTLIKGAVKKGYKKGGKVKAKKPRDGRIKKAKCRDGIAQRGKTRGRMR